MVELSLLVKVTVILAAALLATRAAVRAAASIRALVLASAFAVLLVLPLAVMTIPARTVELPMASMPAGLFVQDDLFNASLASAAPQGIDIAPPVASTFRMPSLTALVRIAWAAGALLFLSPIVIALWRLRRMRLHGLPWIEGRALIAQVAGHSGVVRSVDVFLHESLAAPMTCGLFRPAIGLPVDAPTWTDAELRHALVHEMEHVRRRDWPVHLMARMVCAFYWFHPLAWVAWRQLSLESERACDDAVLRGAEGTAYAEQLVSLARRLSKHSPVPMLSMADRSNLSMRVTAVLASDLARGRAGLLSGLLILGAAVAIVLAISPLQAVTTTIHSQSLKREEPSKDTERAFEVASIRRNMSGARAFTVDASPNGKVTIINAPLRVLIREIYRVQDSQIVDAPNWIADERYDITATAMGGRPPDAVIRSVMADRFQLAVHVEQRERPAYALVFATTDRRPGAHLRQGPVDCAAARLSTTPGRRECGFSLGAGTLKGFGVSAAELAAMLSNQAGRVVVDRTGLDGQYELDLNWTPDAAPDAASASAALDNRPSLFTALTEQLGLRLEPVRTPVDVLVIDRVERPTPNDAPQPTAAQSLPLPADAPSFEVASIRQNTSETTNGGTRPLPDGFTATNVSLRTLIFAAYRIPNRQIIGGASWVDAVRYDIVAKAAGNPSPDQVNAMLRSLLRDRFHFEAHPEMRDFDVYALVLARPDGRLGPRLQKAAIDCADPAARAKLANTPFDPNARPVCGLRSGPGRFVAGGTTMASLVQGLRSASGRTVLDRTGLAEAFDIELEWAPTPDADGVSVFTAVQEQLGLKLESARAPLEVLVIDRAEPPTEN